MEYGDKVDPADDIDDPAGLFDFPFTTDGDTIQFLNSHSRIFFIVRGLPGSRKKVLGDLLKELYHGSKMFWADKVFLGPLAEHRSKRALGESHKTCYAKIEKFMKENVPVIINRNSNVVTSEVSRYIRLSLQYGYTIILAETKRKISASPELLMMSNTKRLGKTYLTERGKQWEEIYPLYTGWFLKPCDGFRLQKRYAEISSAASKSGLKIPQVVHAEFMIFCLGRLCSFGRTPNDRLYCDCDKVQDGYGLMHTLTIFGYAVVDNVVVAAVKLREDQQTLINTDDSKPSSGTAVAGIQVDEWEATTCSLNLQDVVHAQTHQEEPTKLEKLAQVPSADQVSFIVLGHTEGHHGGSFLYGEQLQLSLQRFSRMRMTGGVPNGEKIAIDEIDVYKVEDELLIVDSSTLLLGSVFTGFYQDYSVSTPVCKYFNSPKGCLNGPVCKFRHKKI